MILSPPAKYQRAGSFASNSAPTDGSKNIGTVKAVNRKPVARD
jgi:hypothetical protein